MQHDFWHDRWQTGRIAFHEPLGDPFLAERWAAMAAPAQCQRPITRVLVTLCGKSRDMIWLANQGYAVVGVELSAIAAHDFFTESNLPFAVTSHGAFQAYRSTTASSDITILVGDVFDLDAALLGDVQAVYDRAATIALPQDLRDRYAKHLTQLLAADALMLLVAMEYDESRMHGPPFSVSDAQVHALYDAGFAVELLSEVSGPEIAGSLRERGLQSLTERAYRLRRRG